MAENEVQLVDFDAYVKELEAESSPGPGPDVLLLTCIDFRFFKKIAEKMGNVKYDHLILAGAALGAVVPAKQATWGVTFTDHVSIARQLHPTITKFIVMEHRECGAYGPAPGFGLLPAKPNVIDETRAHVLQVMSLYLRMIPSGLKFEFLLLSVPPDTNAIRCEKVDLTS
jgi:carbonic anhydrase